MDKPFYIFLFIILFCCEAKTQTEYITNGSFEHIDSCYGAQAALGFDVFEWVGCKGWSNPIASSSDLWCENPKVGNVTPPLIPSQGYQTPRTGQNMAGILIGDNGCANYREYIQNKLTQTLKLNTVYRIDFFLSKGVMPCTTNKFGIKFFNAQYSDISTLWLTNIQPDAENDVNNFITDTLDWQKVSMTYKARGNENYVIIGSFADSLRLTLEPIGCDTTGSQGYVYGIGYIFIDDVSITEIAGEEPIVPNVFSPNSDGVNDLFRFVLNDSILNTTIYNRWGLKVFETGKVNYYWDGRTTAGELCTDGTYYYIINTERKNYRGFVQLIR